VTDRAELATIVAESDDHPARPADGSVAGTEEAVDKPDTLPEPATRSSSGRALAVTCSVVAVVAALITLTAPTLRPAIAGWADGVFGKGNVLSRVIAPAIDTTWRAARDEALLAVNLRMTDYTNRIDQLAAAQQAAIADVARTAAITHAPNEALVRSVEDLTRQTQTLRAETAALDVRTRAAGVLTLSLRLRRDIDAGLPIDRDSSALMASGPYPEPVERSLQQLRALSNGAPTMRDLADGFDRLMARSVARNEQMTSWASRNWSRVTSLFGAGTPNGNAALLDHLRALAADGRFSEAADAVEASSYADLGRDWASQVRSRATAVVAAQTILNYSLTAYEDAYAAQGGYAGGKPTQ
jgi:hypothetical protein